MAIDSLTRRSRTAATARISAPAPATEVFSPTITMAQAPGRAASSMRLFDAHCHLQDPRIAAAAPALIRAATASGVGRFAVNGTSEKDWHLVKQMAQEHPAVIPCFGLHPWQDSLAASRGALLLMLSGF
ncbi:hypothetical protein VPH35_030541 [Triticum aestivum]